MACGGRVVQNSSASSISNPIPRLDSKFITALSIVCAIVFVAGLTKIRAEDDNSLEDKIAAICTDWDGLPTTKKSEASRSEYAGKILSLGADAEPWLIKRLEMPTASAPGGDIVIFAFARMKAKAGIPVLTDLVLKGDWTKANAAADALGELGQPDSVALLMPGLSSSNPAAVLATIKALQNLGHNRECADVLGTVCIDAFQAASVDLKINIIKATAYLETPAGDLILNNALYDEHAPVKAAAVGRFTVTYVSQHKKMLIDLLARSPDPILSRRVAEALGRAKVVESVPQLISFLEGNADTAKETVHWALKNITGQDFGMNAARWKEWYESQKGVASQIQDTVLSQLVKGSSESKAVIIEEAIGIIDLREKLVPILLQCRRDPDFCVRAAAYNALGQAGGLVQPMALVDGLSDKSPEVSYTAWRALRQLTGQQLPRDGSAWLRWCSTQR
jgi:HEAT repeat protein